MGLAELWMEEGPSKKAEELLEMDGGSLAGGQRIMLKIVWLLWNGRGDVSLSDLVRELDAEHLTVISSLVVAMARGPDAIDRWLAEANG